MSFVCKTVTTPRIGLSLKVARQARKMLRGILMHGADGADGFTEHDFPLEEGLYGELTLDLSAEDEIIYLVISAVPDELTTLQTYPYEVRIGQE